MHFFSRVIPSLARDFHVFVIAVLIAIALVSTSIIIIVYHSHVENRTHHLELKAAAVERALNESIDYMGYLLTFAGNQIAATDAKDKQYIAMLITGFRQDLKAKSIASWSMLDWVDTNQQLVAASTLGVLKTPVDLSMRNTLTHALDEPWKLFIGMPAKGAISGQQIIPMSMGVADKKGTILGALHVALTVSGLAGKIEHVLEGSGFRFFILNQQYEIIIQSHPSVASQENNFFLSLSSFSSASGTLLPAVVHNNFRYTIYKTFAKYPYIVVLGYDKAVDANRLHRKLLLPFIISTMFGLVTVGLLYYFYHRIITPIVQLASTADNIAQGDYSLRASYAGDGEVQKLSAAFNGMLEKIAEDKNTLEQRVAERTESLQDALNARSDFLNHISHEIRTPVSSIHARSDILMELWADFKHEELKESIQDIQRNALQVCGLVTSLLDLSKSNAGKMVYDMQPNDIALIAQEVAEECRPLYQQKGLELVVEMRAREPVVLCDRMRIGQVIRNLLSNACRYTAKGKVVLLLENNMMQGEDGKQVRAVVVSVKDEGVGIPEGEKTRIFEAFTQSSRTNTKAGGTGLGLAIARTIITAHHGQIWAENNQATAGSTFLFWVPKEGAQR